jgi:hypothetical protein
LQTVIGQVYSSLGDFPRARALEGAIESWRSAGAVFELATTLRALAWVNYRQGNSVDALKRLDEALPLLDANTQRDADELAQLHSYRALALQATGATDAALGDSTPPTSWRKEPASRTRCAAPRSRTIWGCCCASAAIWQRPRRRCASLWSSTAANSAGSFPQHQHGAKPRPGSARSGSPR